MVIQDVSLKQVKTLFMRVVSSIRTHGISSKRGLYGFQVRESRGVEYIT
jgi:hypothetical protein